MHQSKRQALPEKLLSHARDVVIYPERVVKSMLRWFVSSSSHFLSWGYLDAMEDHRLQMGTPTRQ